MQVVIVTGLSGSGKTVALRTLEDLHFFCVDNLPVSLIQSLLSSMSLHSDIQNVAIGIDIREGSFLDSLGKSLVILRQSYSVKVLFLDADTDVLIRRFKETRRPHPLEGDLEDSIRAERARLSIVKQYADRIIDTSSYSPHQLRKAVSMLFSPTQHRKSLSVSLTSFGFKYGVPENVDILFDVRFLPNPHFVPHLKDLNGMDSPVSDYVLRNKTTRDFLSRLRNLLSFLIPQYLREGRQYLSIAIGCTGGNHRSPAIVQEVSRYLDNKKIDLTIIHRDMS